MSKNVVKINVTKSNKDAIKYLLNIKDRKINGASFNNKIISQNGKLMSTNSVVMHCIDGFDVPDGIYDYESTTKSLYLTQTDTKYPDNIYSRLIDGHCIFQLDNVENKISDKKLFCKICNYMFVDFKLYEQGINENSITNIAVREYSAMTTIKLLVVSGKFNDYVYESIIVGMFES